MGKTWKDLPKDVSNYKPFRKRNKGPAGRYKPLSDKLKEPPETPVLEEVEYEDTWSP